MHAPQDGPAASRALLVTADDFGIGPEVTRGILELAADGLVSATVLLTNSPFAEDAVRRWRRAGSPLEVGWHPCLTLDAPLLPAGRVASLVGADGRFLTLGRFLGRLALGKVNRAELRDELTAQLERFYDLTGFWPRVVNAHHHVHVFPPVGGVLRGLLRAHRPFLRRVSEPLAMVGRVPGARGKRAFLALFGSAAARRQERAGFPGAGVMLGTTDPATLADERFFERWLDRVPGSFVEMACHPGHRDETVLGRDATPADGQLERRARELELLRRPGFLAAVARNGFTIVHGSYFRRAAPAA
jgi:predicted glycoside hydrolase/deacetylase ChbG (UPF0249 family)